MSPAEAVKFAREMREAGVARFTLQGERLTCVLLPPGPTPLTEIAERIGELPAEERLKIAKMAKEDFERDLFGGPQ